MDGKVLLVTISCSRLSGILEIFNRHGFVVFGMMGGEGLAGLKGCPVYFYETG